MEKIRLLILHNENDKEYSLALGKAISNLHNDFDVTVTFYSYIKDFKYDLILASCIYNNLVEFTVLNNNNCVIYLTEDKVEKSLRDKPVKELYKYSRIQDLASKLRIIYAFFFGKKNIVCENKACKFIGFYSAGGGNGKTAVSIGVAQELVRYHDKKVLYLSLEEFESTHFYLQGGTKNKNISDFLYYLFNKEHENICTFITSFTFLNPCGVEFFYPAKGSNELNKLKNEELYRFLKFIEESRRYDYVVLDLPYSLNNQTLELLQNCFKVILIERDEFISIKKSNNAINYFIKKDYSIFPENYIRVRNMVINNDENEAEGEEVNKFEERKIIFIDKDESSFSIREEIKEIDLDNVFGLGIKEVVNEIIK
ncbi:AAA family ATPase [Anaerovorax odorimutans]|uniref:AAA family ATPase n=1 Tax=Anaerovorax odorimutans TaxID=109327 RepID=UPI000405E3CC|nr:AAA family ATPase [Anaerovorax odorimutans]